MQRLYQVTEKNLLSLTVHYLLINLFIYLFVVVGGGGGGGGGGCGGGGNGH